MKKTGALLLAVMMLCTACTGKEPDGLSGTVNQSSNPMDEGTGAFADQEMLTPVAVEPLWAQGVQTDGALYTGLNLDGIGEADDEAYVGIYSFGEEEHNGITILRLRLGTGETMARIFPVWGKIGFRTGCLFSTEREAVLLEVDVWGSNYLAANVFVIDVSPAADSGTPEAVVRIDTSEEPLYLVDGSRLSIIRTGTEIVEIEGSALQGLRFHSPSKRMEDWKEMMRNSTICWAGEDGGGWMLEYVDETVADGNGWEFDTERGSHKIAGTEEPLWAQGIQANGALFEGLNLDGVGKADDAVYVSGYCFCGDGDGTFTVLRIHVGTGETVAVVLPVYGAITFKTGRLFTEEKDGILLEVWDRSDSREEAAVYAINVSSAEAALPNPLPLVGVHQLDVVSLIPPSGIPLTEGGFRCAAGTDIVDIEGSSLQGVSLRLMFGGE